MEEIKSNPSFSSPEPKLPSPPSSPEDLCFQLQRWATDERFPESASFRERRDRLMQSLNKRKEAVRRIQRQQLRKERLMLQKRLETLMKKTNANLRKPIEAPEPDTQTENEEVMDEEESQLVERCRFYPNCQKEDCAFFHPSEDCPHFPNCKFATLCCYAHPKCRYDPFCSRPDCNYQHSGQKFTPVLPPPPPPPPSMMYMFAPPHYQPVRCRYHPHCQNPHCVFIHPSKPCRFGLLCVTKETCLFEHPPKPDRRQFKWSKTVVADKNGPVAAPGKTAPKKT